MPAFDFSRPSTNIPHDKLLWFLNEITDFAFKGMEGEDARDYVSAYSSGAFWSKSKSKLGRSYSITQIKFSFEFIRNKYFQICSKISCHAICILMGSDPVQLYAIPCFIVFTYLTGWRPPDTLTIGLK